MSPLISIVIPTRSRAETLGATLRSALESDFDDYEVIVSDNMSEDRTRQVVDELAGPRLRYFRTDKRLSMCDNWDFALTQVKGRFVIFIGDDDAIVPGGIERLAAKIAELPEQRAYTWRTSTYQWPIDGVPAKLVYDSGPGDGGHSVGDLRRAATRVMERGGWGYYWLPSTYHGAIASDVLSEIARTTGRLFHSTVPDLFTALAIPALVPQFVRLSSAVTIQGRSAKSNGGSSIASDGAEVMARFIREYGDYAMHPTMPVISRPVGSLIVDSFLRAKDMFPALYEQVPFNYSAMWAFLRRLELVDRGDVYGMLDSIRRHHRFSRLTFEAYCVVHDALALRRSLLDRLSDRQERAVPANIYDFAHQL